MTALRQKRDTEALERRPDTKEIRRLQSRAHTLALRMHRGAHKRLEVNNKMSPKDLEVYKIRTLVRIADYLSRMVGRIS